MRVVITNCNQLKQRIGKLDWGDRGEGREVNCVV